MKIEIRSTGDGSNTIYLPHLDETYHSTHGAVQEANHVFIEHGLRFFPKSDLRIFELGFGTGLNAILTFIEAGASGRTIEYTGIEAFPIDLEIAQLMRYERLIGEQWKENFELLHTLPWNEVHVIHPQFSFRKVVQKMEDFIVEHNKFDIFFFDAFGPRVQGELWQPAILEKMHAMLKVGGFLVTYCAMGQFKRDLKAIGFEIEVLPGPPGKREMTRAFKF
ncbi:MAG: tRNA (5-methylaminomethyl-2-thiouridine)(34)-methyltransferase MnmD [Bacteroidota bacterium]